MWHDDIDTEGKPNTHLKNSRIPTLGLFLDKNLLQFNQPWDNSKCSNKLQNLDNTSDTLAKYGSKKRRDKRNENNR